MRSTKSEALRDLFATLVVFVRQAQVAGQRVGAQLHAQASDAPNLLGSDLAWAFGGLMTAAARGWAAGTLLASWWNMDPRVAWSLSALMHLQTMARRALSWEARSGDRNSSGAGHRAYAHAKTEAWADMLHEVEQAIAAYYDAGNVDCEACGGTGVVEGGVVCLSCDVALERARMADVRARAASPPERARSAKRGAR